MSKQYELVVNYVTQIDRLFSLSDVATACKTDVKTTAKHLKALTAAGTIRVVKSSRMYPRFYKYCPIKKDRSMAKTETPLATILMDILNTLEADRMYSLDELTELIGVYKEKTKHYIDILIEMRAVCIQPVTGPKKYQLVHRYFREDLLPKQGGNHE